MIKCVRFKSFPNLNYPFLPCFEKTNILDLSQPITIFVGDNGSGKSTLLKAIAYDNQSINVSGQSQASLTYQDVKKLGPYIECAYEYKTKKGFFFSGEEFMTYIQYLKNTKEILEDDLKRIEKEYRSKSAFSRAQARMAPMGQLSQMNQIYGGELNKKSHGESFLAFFKSRMHQKGLYLLDEPETPLSAENQYQLMVLISDLIENGSKVIIATHSPILMALEKAQIYHFGDDLIEPMRYEDIETVQFMKDFLNHKDLYLSRIKKRD